MFNASITNALLSTFDQITLMDANYVMDESLGTASYDITRLRVGQTKVETFLFGKVRHVTSQTHWHVHDSNSMLDKHCWK